MMLKIDCSLLLPLRDSKTELELLTLYVFLVLAKSENIIREIILYPEPDEFSLHSHTQFLLYPVSSK
jgi:hypothetical protein